MIKRFSGFHKAGYAKRIAKQQAGFTIIELLIASTIFSVVLLLISYAVLQIGRTYSKGLMQTRVQEVTRTVSTQLADAIKYGSVNPTLPPPGPATSPATFCLNNFRYTYVTDKRVVTTAPQGASEAYHALVVDNQPGNCGTAHSDFTQPQVANAKELLSPNMRLAKLDITSTSDGLVTVTLRVIAGVNELLSDDHTTCKNQREGNQFCAVSEVTTTVRQRLSGVTPTGDSAGGCPGGSIKLSLFSDTGTFPKATTYSLLGEATATACHSLGNNLTVYQGDSIKVGWQIDARGTPGYTCEAQGTWSGNKTGTGEELRAADTAAPGTKTYRLHCFESGNAQTPKDAYATIVLTVQPYP